MDTFHISSDTVADIIKLSIPVIFSFRDREDNEKLCGCSIWLDKTNCSHSTNIILGSVPNAFNSSEDV